MLDGFETVSEWIEEEKNFDKYILTDTEQEELEAFWEKKPSLKTQDYKSQIHFVEELKTFDDEVKARLDKESNTLLEDLKNQDPGYASDAQKAWLVTYATQMEQMIQDENYRGWESLAEEWKNYVAVASVKKQDTV